MKSRSTGAIVHDYRIIKINKIILLLVSQALDRIEA
jgi:hypothetical protein